MSLGTAPERSDPFADVPPNLAGALVDDEVLVEGIVLDIVRTLCIDRDIRVGDRLRVRDREDGAVIVRNVKGRSVRVPESYAFFIQIRQLPDEFTGTLVAAH